jgi:hypothetical protein
MANEHDLAVLAKGVAAWNQWRQEKYDQDNRAVERFIQTKETNDLCCAPQQAGRRISDLGHQRRCRSGAVIRSCPKGGVHFRRQRPRCKGKESDLFAKRSGAAMYSASECSRSGCGP